MFNPSHYSNSRPGGIGVLEIVGNGKPRKPEEPRRFVPLRRTELRGQVLGPLASLCVRHTYGYTRQQCNQVLEARYSFPLPGDAATIGVVVRFGEVEITASLQERRQAEREYEEAVKGGRQAALVTRESPDVFTLQVAGLQPDQEVTVETRYVELARAEGRGWSLRVPLTTAPRYVRSDELSGRHAQGQPLALARDPGHRFALDVDLVGAERAQSPTHELETVPTEGGLRVRLAAGEVVPDRDLVLCWHPRQEAERPSLAVWTYDEPSSQQNYFLALVTPPGVHEPGRAIAREVIVLEDHSGSMSGAKWEAADWATKQFLSRLSERDSFALGLFHSETHWLAHKVQPATPESIQEAIRFLEGHTDSGGTELGVALEQALHLNRAPGEHARHVLIITDAQVTDAGRLLRLVEEEWEGEDPRRISVLCIDAAPNSFLALELAERGGGRAEFLTSSPEEEDITSGLERILDSWTEPVLAGLRLEVNRRGLEAAGRRVEAAAAGRSRADLGDLPAGQAVWVAGRVPRAGDQALEFSLTTSGEEQIASCAASAVATDTLGSAVKALFGARRVLALEHLSHAGYDMEELGPRLSRLGYDADQILEPRRGRRRKVYAENTRADVQEALRELLVREALDYGLLCSETGFVAVRKEAGKKVAGAVAVANALPTGWSEAFALQFRALPRLGRGTPSSAAFMSYRFVDADAMQYLSLRRDVRCQSLASMQERLREQPAQGHVIFSGTPQFTAGEAVLLDTTRKGDQKALPTGGLLSGIAVEFPEGRPDPKAIPPQVVLVIFVGDLAAPRASLRLRDLVRQGGRRPLNLARRAGEPVRILLRDPTGAWSARAGRVVVSIEFT